ncbi:50S ribosomal protein L11 methyltransferase [Streptomyces sp. NBC_01142]|uniref:50S ribosomal protein L11 methyltransferase n=1 Tax=Streptomyces sp. NBC_01142 TaxID=2975865 RepID=UPI00225967EB|nr:50S ribosomal protein L11 methyltransferase [Streptomyces sp. NBC_01142]MCX4824569.1 50S ribosomal protein L11 methyltransferase [Streptomyces sp. NBC_01142]
MADEELTTVQIGARDIALRTGYSVREKGIGIFPSEGEYPVYNDDTYDAMNDDMWCDAAYMEAITRYVPGRIVLDIGTGRDANWAVAAARAGAKKVYAVEVLPEWAQAAAKTVEEAGLSDTITVLTCSSTDVQLPEKIDVCVSEIIGTIGGSEGAASSIRDARQRFMENTGISIPHRCTTGIAGASLAAHFPDGIVLDPDGVETVERIFAAVGHPFDVRLSLDGPVQETLVTETSEVEELAFNGDLSTEGEDRISLTVTRDDRLTGLVLWPLLLARKDGVALDAIRMDTSWLPLYAPLFLGGVAVRRGDVLEAVFRRQLSDDLRHPDYHITGTVRREGRDDIPFEWRSPHHAPAFRTDDAYRWLFPEQ